ncbi:FkbM family methyltransferase [Yoonia sp. 2307UL14-13]|uniref:FkbM family methyltransferase n=1 Tax=Yoonia sp. 2307UL14-13 TaxID=3126506 RepID=UPI0030978709
MRKGFRKVARHCNAVWRRILAGPNHGKIVALEKEVDLLFDTIAEKQGVRSYAQYRQDIFALIITRFKTGGYFVDFGATDGIGSSNSYVLEKDYGWTGILAEPARVWHDDLRKNRSAHIETDCVWSETGKTLKFSETKDPYLSTLASFRQSDEHRRARAKPITYDVTTISLMDLLRKYDAPRQIDYLSIDTEGSEFDILRHFDFDAYDISVITCEHNYTKSREDIRQLLESSGYRRAFHAISRYDDWYVKADL